MICGRISTEISYSHSVLDEHFNKFFVTVKRGNGIEDSIPIIASVRIIEPSLLNVGIFVQLTGQYRAHTDCERHKQVFVLARSIEVIDEELYLNEVFLDGVICKEPCYRRLKSGKEITGLCVANNQKHDKAYYLPVIVWDKYAKEVSHYNVGDIIECKGRIQSRNYYKEDRMFSVYEMNVQSICKIKSNNQQTINAYNC